MRAPLLRRLLLPVTGGVLGGCLPDVGADDIVLLNDFEAPDSWGDGWVAEGESFVDDRGRARKPPDNGWEARLADTLGRGCVDTWPNDPEGLLTGTAIDLQDAATGSLTSPDFTIERRYLNLALDGGSATGIDGFRAGLEVYVDGALHHVFTGDADFPLRLRPMALDLVDHQGATLQLVVRDANVGGFGWVAVDQLTLSDAPGFDADVLVESFDSSRTGAVASWTGDGVFADANSWGGAALAGGKIGDGLLTSCASDDCYGGTGSLMSSEFEVTAPYLVMALTGGGGLGGVGVQVIDGGQVVAEALPGDCGTTLDSDDAWTTLDLSRSVGNTVSIRVFDDATYGCGSITVDHIYLSGRARGAEATSSPRSEDDLVKVTLADDGLDDVIARFDDPEGMVASGWSATGDFADPSGVLAWSGTTTDPDAARVGLAAVGTCELGGGSCDGPTGALQSPPFTLSAGAISFLMAGGDGATVGVELLDDAGATLATYHPDSCAPSFIDGDDDWAHIDASAYIGETVSLRFFDESSGACGFVSFDHAYVSDTGRGETVAVATEPEPTPVATNCTVADDAFDDVLGDFDDATAMVAGGWIATGDFAAPATAAAWEGTSRDAAAAHVGERAVSTCELAGGDCDGPTGTLTSAPFTVSSTALSFLMAGGDGGGGVGLEVVDAEGAVVARHWPSSCDPSFVDGDDDWAWIDMTALVGQTVQVVVFDESAGSCGFVGVDHIYASDTGRGTLVDTAEAGETLPECVNCTAAADAFDTVVADFESPLDLASDGWTLTGDFAGLSSIADWRGTTANSAAARVGEVAVSTCELGGAGCDGPTGSLSSPLFTVTADALSFLAAGGGGGADVSVEVLDAGGTVLARFVPESCSPSYIDGDEDWHHIDVSAHLGTDVRLRITDAETGGCGFISFDHFYLSDTGRGDAVGGR